MCRCEANALVKFEGINADAAVVAKLTAGGGISLLAPLLAPAVAAECAGRAAALIGTISGQQVMHIERSCTEPGQHGMQNTQALHPVQTVCIALFI